MHNKIQLILILLAFACGQVMAQQAGDLDRSFNYGRGVDYQFNNGYGTDNAIYSSTLQPDGKIIIGGAFTTYSGNIRNRIARLNADGSLDNTFEHRTGANGEVVSITLQPDGKIIIGGDFTTYNGTIRNRIARLNANGSLDNTFNPGTGANGAVYSTSLQPNGRIMIGGQFSTYNSTLINCIARLNADGSLDNNFNSGTGANAAVYSTTLQPDGKTIIAGNFTAFNDSTRNRVARLNADGSLDNTFSLGIGANNPVYATTLLSNGKIIIGGSFTLFNGSARNRIARLNADGSFDNTFNPRTGANDEIWSITLHPNGKILIGGFFTSYNGTTRNRIARLNADGSLDNTFNPGTGATALVYYTALQPNGNIVICGWFTNFNGIARNYIARLNTNGFLDSTFSPRTGASDNVLSTAFQPDGKIIIGGDFTTYNGIERNNIARLNVDGSLDNSFNLGNGANGTVNSIALETDGKIIIGGAFTTYNGINRNRIARLNADGSLDTTFNPGTGANNFVLSITLQPDGNIIIGGWFNSYNGNNRNRIARLNTDGSLDTTFKPGSGADWFIYPTALQPNGKIIVGGDFNDYDGTLINRIVRLNADTSLDNTFNPGTGANGAVYATALQPDGKIIIGGAFTTYNGTTRNRIARLNADGSLDNTFNPGAGANDFVYSTTLQPDGKIIVGGAFTTYNGSIRNRIVRLNANGILDNNFNPGTGANGEVYSTTLQPDGKIIIAGRFTGYNNLSAPFVVRIHGCAPPATPAILGNSSFCSGGSTVLTSSVSSGNLWSNGDTSRSINIFGAGSYTVRVILGNCSSEVSPAAIVTARPRPVTPTITQSSDTLFATSGDSLYRWFRSGLLFRETISNVLTEVTGGDSYRVISRLNGCWSDTSVVYIVLGVNSKVSETLKIYPNPASSQFTIEVTSPTQVQVINALGQVVISQTVDNGKNVINTQSLPSGMYSVLANGYRAQSLVLRK
jgi:uncharacterized delta-60 repeat protein